MRLAELPKVLNPHPATEPSQRFLISAHQTANEVWLTREALRRRGIDPDHGIDGGLYVSEEDQGRAAIVFAGTGLDITLKQIVYDALPELLVFDKRVQERFEEFAAQKISMGQFVDPKVLARYLTVVNPRTQLLDDYVCELRGVSLQSEHQVDRVAGALGIDDKTIRKAIPALKPLLVAHNEIYRELDSQRLEMPGDRAGRNRPAEDAKKMCDAGFRIGQQIINAVNTKLSDG